MSAHRYEPASLLADYARAGVGVAVCGGLLLAAQPQRVVAYILALLLLLFAVYALRTAFRQLMWFDVDDRGMRACIGDTVIRDVPWDSLRDLRMRYFSTRRDRKDGWMQLIVGGGGRSLRCDSNLNGFESIVARAYEAARRAGLPLSRTTLTNLKALGLAGDVEMPV